MYPLSRLNDLDEHHLLEKPSTENAAGSQMYTLGHLMEIGEFVIDTTMDLETNTTKGYFRENSLLLQEGEISQDAVCYFQKDKRTPMILARFLTAIAVPSTLLA